ncbi:hypothetical protein CH249_15435 [Rhodococcus sp. 05-2255-3B1]|uniref:hypothetical protein n=1 Tax=unclassified Rhodococcus (in: high G+C Gram-positive bacteria) TaxID=192944 RepID=UPI000B9C1207|nr:MULTISPECIES: hypothetical protein [unclassified Rhodococcus (in: high G+C Gram-positive bacteria)]OZE03182.1 hypothetical protein CH250_23500 [Rhodococcus sp. 05-2255-3C]OZE09571.1 hypothetical protein CH249_15435 [Rhodococcus sp. 05-2255-3B1]OZE14837.1 hypothetical protein CH255_21780 [Rhodococcus sp. 05-2255-2A2]
MTDLDKLDKVTRGVTEAWDFWLSQHEVTAPAAVESGVEAAFGEWLTKNTATLIAAIAERVAQNVNSSAGEQP